MGPSGATCIFMITFRYWCYMNIRNLSNNAKEEAMTAVRYLQDNLNPQSIYMYSYFTAVT